MSPVKRNTFDSFSRLLVGRRLQSLEKRDFSWFFAFADDLSVVTESPWRLIADDRIATTSEDDGHQFGLPKPVDAAERVVDRTSGQSVTAASIDLDTGDLSIEFSGTARIQFLQMSSGYEAWRIYAPGAEFVCREAETLISANRTSPNYALPPVQHEPESQKIDTPLVVAIIHFTSAGFFAYAFYDRFWLWRHEIAEANTSHLTPHEANVNALDFPGADFAILGFTRIARYAFSSHHHGSSLAVRQLHTCQRLFHLTTARRSS